MITASSKFTIHRLSPSDPSQSWANPQPLPPGLTSTAPTGAGRIDLSQSNRFKSQHKRPGADGASSLPEVTDPFYRLPLPTVFIKQMLLTLETCYGYEYDQTQKSSFSPDFQGPSRAHQTP